MKIQHYKPKPTATPNDYPAVGDQLDAIFKMAQALKVQGIELPEDTVNWINKCREVKEKYKKP